jgi:hypothetical protein
MKLALEDIRAWVKEGNRSVSIHIGKAGDPEYEYYWCYDYDFKIGIVVENTLPAKKDFIEKKKIELIDELKSIEDL